MMSCNQEFIIDTSCPWLKRQCFQLQTWLLLTMTVMYFSKGCEICFHLALTAGVAILFPVWEPRKHCILLT